MNSLSWMIYAADALGHLRPLFGLTAFAGVFGIIGAIAGANGAFDGYVWSSQGKDARDKAEAENASRQATCRRIAICLGVTVPVLAALAALLPSTTTVYMIAASEAGEAVVTSADGQAMLSDVKALIRKKLAEELQEGSAR